jgi:hypothetical protein
MAAIGIMRKTARRQHDASPRPDLDLALRRFQHGATYRATLLQQPRRRRRGPQINAQIRGGAQQPRHQRNAVAELHAAAMDGEVHQVSAESARHVDEGLQRTRDVHERRQIRPGLNGHAHEGGLAHRSTQPVDKIAEPAGVIRGRNHRAATSPRAGSVSVSVGDLVAALELKSCILFKEGYHFRRGAEALTLASSKLLPSTSRR